MDPLNKPASLLAKRLLKRFLFGSKVVLQAGRTLWV